MLLQSVGGPERGEHAVAASDAAHLGGAQARAAQVGAAIYALRVPERWWPGAFDLAFHSHQLFHLCVVGAAAVHYRGVRVLLAWRDASGVCL